MLRSFFIVILLFVVGCEQNKQQALVVDTSLDTKFAQQAADGNASKDDQSEISFNETLYTKIEWDALILAEIRNLLENPPNYLSELPDGLTDEELLKLIDEARQKNEAEIIAYEKALASTEVVKEMAGKKVTIPGFVVPVAYNEQQQVTRFFLVPYFGACIHSPPPPPNQIIYVENTQGLELEYLYDPILVSGTLTIDLFEDELATSAYVMSLEHYKPYYD
ncbi:DUF3299 domain-containing protein [Catenovulum agarivorans]|uniref:DUF3299 domain-containing protein n=1 Tax=Catenovulum agarivorans TaxID=1172192 RepID=UPI0002D955F7|nr:DUF3299 domain-containing protein [Catenovulum agarivorans]